MHKDFKIGLVLGLAVVAAAALWLSTRPSLTTKARMLHSRSVRSAEETFDEQPRFVTDLPKIPSREAAAEAKENSVLEVPPYEQTDEVKTQRFHIVRRGETLSDIAYKYYGSASKWKKILSANDLELRDTTKLRPGTKLIIPE
ncbi:MAG: LysM peptidoglycan-binding domain-containing protein [Planctomycetota bacterium]|nr:MAG: LysM peptidoglycan-binding domain-containing protein [Planctomycetota bacterium]